jgi:1-acyl-sn-glycerol-3-phosphate acyltransferase
MIRFFLLLPLTILEIILFSGLTIIAIWSDKTGDNYYKVSKIWARFTLFCVNVKVKVIGLENIQEGQNYIFLSNHQSFLDIPILTVSIPFMARFIYRDSLHKVPFFGSSLKKSPHISINKEDIKKAMLSLEKAAFEIQNGKSVLIFPEGTRTSNGKISNFKRGGFQLAVKATVPLIPVAISGSFNSMPKGTWLIKPQKVFVIFGKPRIVKKDMTRAEEFELMNTIKSDIEDLIKLNLS